MKTNYLPNWFNYTAHALPWLLCTFFLFVTLTSPEQMELYTAKDHVEGGGLIEKLTVVILIPGIIAGLYTFFKYRKFMQPWWTAYWLLMWSMACIYFAGEEISWGQWLFQWDTPEAFSGINDQNETNLHNISTWLDQKPRTLVELWIFFTGLVFPVIQLLRKTSYSPNNWQYWIHPVTSLVSAAAFFTIVRFAGWSGNNNIEHLFGSSETRELCVALFLSLFLLSYLARLAGTHNN